MNKRGLIVLSFGVALIFLLGNFAFAAENETASADTAEKAYACLNDQIQTRGNLSLKEATFGALALGSKGNIVSRIEADRDSKSCWPKGACKLKETAQVALAYKGMGKDTSAIKSWILSKNATATDLKWFLQIDIPSRLASTCKIKDGTKEVSIKILEDMRIQGSPGSCFALDSGNFALRINTNCMKNTFEISCDQDFITSTLYQKNAGGTIFVLPETHSAASLGSTKESVNGECLKTESGCDYEGTLWSALALQKVGEDPSRFMPYLLALSEENARFFPSAFLYILAGGDDQYNVIIQEQKQTKFWEVAGSKDGRYFDTSLAMMALGGKGAAELDNARTYLASIQTKEGCWNSNNIRDTAFILYSGWPKGVISAGEISSPTECVSPFSCENAFDCTQAGGTVEYNYACPSVGQSCCSISVLQQSCAEKQGILCGAGKECQGGRVEPASDGSCCFGACVDAAGEDTCVAAGGTCLISCGDDEEVSYTETCATTDETCCMAKSGSSLWIWIILLIILITLVVLGIIYREKVKFWWFRLMERFKKKPSTPPVTGRPMTPAARPGAPFAPFVRPMPPQQRPTTPIVAKGNVPSAVAKTSPKLVAQIKAPPRAVNRDKEMEEALRKLREMSKK